jgi:ADP-ribose pyrophosphatase YjhB (NUDIX family)
VGAEAGKWALPGGFVRSAASADAEWRDDVESPAAAALRELAEETGLAVGQMTAALVPLGVFEGGGRDPRDTDMRFSRSHGFLLELPAHLTAATVFGGDDAGDARWFDVGSLPPLAFDHAAIVVAGLSAAGPGHPL